jgi:hypothetical protein
MAALTRSQVSEYASRAGFTGDDLNIAVAIAKAESGWNPQSHNSKPPDDSYGLWQINMLGSMGPERRKQFGITKNTDLYDPQTNANAARTVYKNAGNKFTPWTTYTSEKYKSFLSETSGDSSGVTPATAQANPVLGVGSALNALGDTIFKSLANVAGIIVAVVILVVGFLLISRNQLPAGAVGNVVKKVVGK